MTDRELLEAAAKAAGMVRMVYRDDVPYVSLSLSGDDFFAWDPLTDDGDALRLAVKLRIWLDYGSCSDEAPAHITARYLAERGTNSTQRWESVAYIPESMFQEHNDKKYAAYLMEQGEHVRGVEPATRRAIVRAAAEIGQGMPQPTPAAGLPEDNYYKTQAEAFGYGRAK